MKESTKISRNLFSKLCSKWNERNECFEIRSQFVRFTLLYVCLRVRLRVVGPKLNLNEIEVDNNGRKIVSTQWCTHCSYSM